MVNPTRLDYSPQGGRQFESISDAIKGASTAGLNGGRSITADVSATAKDIAHGLGKPYTGYFLIGSDTPISVASPGGEDKSKFVRIEASGPATVTLWVF